MASDCLWDGTLSPGDFQIAAMNLIEKWSICCSTSQPWRWEPCPKLPWGASHDENGYLCLEDVIVGNSNEQHNTAEGECELEEEEEPLDCATLIKSLHSEIHLYTLHIVYNNSYKVPMLLFHGHNMDGKPLELEDIKRDLPSHSCQLLDDSKWTFLTQEEHPYLNRPWYALHPCGTSEWMGFLFSSITSLNAKAAGMVERSTTQTESSSDKHNGQNAPLLEETALGLDSFRKSNIKSPTCCITSKREIICQYLISWLSVVGQAVGLRVPFEIVNSSS